MEWFISPLFWVWTKTTTDKKKTKPSRCDCVTKSKSSTLSTTTTDVSINPTFAPNDSTVVASGGITVGIANLDLPGDFAFRTQEFKITRHGDTETLYSMVPEDPSLQNRRRELISTIGKATVSIT